MENQTQSPPPRRRKRKSESSFGVELGKFMRARMDELEAKLTARIETVEGASMRWRSTWRAGNSYIANDVVQHRSSLWVCKATSTGSQPGTESGWQLMSKPQVVARPPKEQREAEAAK
jgi:hypothetical protein